MMEAPKYNAPPPDPTLTAVKAQAQADDITAMKETATIDTASIAARYGTRLAMAGATTGSPLAVTPPPVAGRV
jgi:hypothetical protein